MDDLGILKISQLSLEEPEIKVVLTDARGVSGGDTSREHGEDVKISG